MRYFKFYPDVELVKGIVKNNIYFFGKGEVVNLDKEESLVAADLENHSIEECEAKYGEAAVQKLIDFMLKNSLGNIYANDVFAEKYIPHMPFSLDGYMETPAIIEELVVEIGDYNSLKLGEDILTIFQGCNSCIPSKVQTKKHSEVMDAIIAGLEGIKNIQINKLTIHCGRVSSYLSDIERVITTMCDDNCAEIELVTFYNEQIPDNIMELLYRYNSSLVLCVEEAMLEDEQEFENELMKIRENIPVKIDYIILHNGDIECKREKYNEIKNILDKLDIYMQTTEVFYSMKDKLISLPTGKSRLENLEVDSYFSRKKINSCLYGKIMIDCNGDIYVCMYGQTSIGTVFEGISLVLEQDRQKYFWERSKRKNALCGKCENRYICADCNTIEELFESKTEYKNLICDYNVAAGEWI